MRHLGAVIAVMSAIFVAAEPAAQTGSTGGSWPIYGKDLSNSRNAGTAGPAKSAVHMLHRAWTFQTPAGLTGTPVVADGLVIAGATDGTVYALDQATGQLRWRWNENGSDYLPGSAAVDGDTVYVTMDSPSVHVFALGLHDGRLRWQTNLDPSGLYSVDASPVIWNGQLYLGIEGVLVEEGRTHARLRGELFDLDASTGAIKWRTFVVPKGHDGGSIWSSPAIDPVTHRLYEGSGNPYNLKPAPTVESILQFDAVSGRLLRHDRPRLPGRDRDYDFGSSPILFQGPHGRKLVGELQKSGVFWAVDARTLREVWSRLTVPHVALESIGSVAYDGRRIYGQDSSGRQWALTTSGHEVWLSPREGPKTNYGPVAASQGVVYASKAAGNLEARAAADGKLLARLPLGAPSWGGVSIAGGCVFTVAGTRPTRTGFVEKFCP